MPRKAECELVVIDKMSESYEAWLRTSSTELAWYVQSFLSTGSALTCPLLC